jgi:hypothetical protein
MPTDEGRRRQLEAEQYRKTEQAKADEAKRRSQEQLRGFHLAVKKRTDEILRKAAREKYGF